MSDLALVVNGRRYGGWKSVRVTRSIESVSGSFELDATDRWADQDIPWAITEEDACRVEINRETVIDGYVDKRSIALAAESRTLSYSGRDRCAALVDCSANLDKWTFRNASVVDVAKKVAAPFGIAVSVQDGLTLGKAPRKMVVSPGDTAFAVIERAAQAAGVLVVSDGAGGIVITRAGSERAAVLVQGENVLALSIDYDASDRFSSYVVVTQVGGTDNAAGGATRIRGSATDEGIRRTDRTLVIRPDSGVTTEYARQRAAWEARVRAARAETVTAVVLGWLQPSGDLWQVNALCRLRAPAIGIDGDLLISQTEFSIGAEGEVTQLRLVRPDAFTPEPTVKKNAAKKKSGTEFAELAGGV